jgi:FkbM family methyltransferase
MASYVGLKQLRLPYTVRFRNGLVFQLQESYDLETLWQISFHAVYPLHVTDRVIVDAGANIGLFTCWAAARNRDAKIIALEPAAENVARLQAHVRANGFEQRVVAIQVALDGGDKVAWLSPRASASQMLRLTDSHESGAIAVAAWSLAELVQRVGEAEVDFLKMDIEGSEYAVLMSTASHVFQRVRRIAVEYHPPLGSGYDKRSLIAHLRACGYTSIADTGSLDSAYGILYASREPSPRQGA